jgi:hypothetical protein
MANSTSYQPPIDKLLTLGSQQLNDATEQGFSSEHIPNLIKMAVDSELLGASDQKLAWGPIHAWRILGQIQATDAILPLIQLFKQQDNDLVNEELPKVFGKIGNAAIPELAKYLNCQDNQLLARVTAINSLEEIAQQRGARDEVINVFTQSLQSCNLNPSELNGFIVSSLINLQARETAPQIKYAFNTNQIAEDIVGDWDEVRESLGINSDEEVEEYYPQALQQLTDSEAETNIETEEKISEEEQEREEELNSLIDAVIEVTETETETQENTLSVTEAVSKTDNIQLLPGELEVQHNTTDTEESLIGEIGKVEDEIKEFVSEIEASEETQLAVTTLVEVNESHEQTKEESIESVNVGYSEELNQEKEDIRGFGRPATSKEKSEKPHKVKPSKKKKLGFSDL